MATRASPSLVDSAVTLRGRTTLVGKRDRAGAVGTTALFELPRDGRYEARGSLGEGGMGVVSLVRDRQIGRDVARKTLRPEALSDPQSVAAFVHEARIQAQLEHPAIVPVYDVGIGPDGSPYFTMRRMRGMTLHEIIDGLARGDTAVAGRFSERRLLSIFSTVCAAVAFANEHGVLHRDLKPENIVVGEYGEVHVLDWGLGTLWAPDASPLDAGETPALLEPGELVLGTPGYMSPEQCMSLEVVGPESDVYALGSILFELLTLQPLHVSQTAESIMEETVRGVDARPSRRPEVPAIAPELEELCVQATARDPMERIGSARALRDAVEAYLDGQRDEDRRRALAAEHVDVARRALEKPSEDPVRARRSAMQALGRALGLDPGNRDAMSLLRNLLVEEPSDLPAPVVESMHRSTGLQLRSAARIGGLAYVGILIYVPLLLAAGIQSRTALLLFLGVMILAGGASIMVGWTHDPKRGTGRAVWGVLLLSTLGLALTTTLFGPLVLVPQLLAVNAIPFAILFQGWSRVLAGVVASAGILVPLLLESLGVLPPTYTFSDAGMTIAPRMVAMSSTWSPIILAVAGVASIFTGIFTVGLVRDALARAERRLHLYSWHLGQLLPSESA